MKLEERRVHVVSVFLMNGKSQQSAPLVGCDDPCRLCFSTTGIRQNKNSKEG
jgi:hypothetical protein